VDKCEHIWLYIGNKRQKVWRCTLCDEYRLVTTEQKSQETLEGMQGEYVKPPSGSYTLWENTMCNPLGDMRTQTQNAWHDGYASAKVQRPWQGLTDEEIRNEANHHVFDESFFNGAVWARGKIEEKNRG
jgi:hypothetical protein